MPAGGDTSAFLISEMVPRCGHSFGRQQTLQKRNIEKRRALFCRCVDSSNYLLLRNASRAIVIFSSLQSIRDLRAKIKLADPAFLQNAESAMDLDCPVEHAVSRHRREAHLTKGVVR
jgi:hypothetical protein